MWKAYFSALVLAAGLALPQASFAQEDTLADIRQELTVLYVEIQRLKRELSTTGAAPVTPGGRDTLDRIDTIEAGLRRLTGRTEELEFRIDRIVRDGTNRIGDLEFRLCELETSCDIATLGDTPSLGGGALVTTPPVTPPANTGSDPELAVGEAADFQAAKQAFEAREYASAVARIDAFLNTYSGSPLAPEALFLKGSALESQGDLGNAARAYLAAFNAAPDGSIAPAALLALGLALDGLGQKPEACTLLGEVTKRFPGGPEDAAAQTEAAARGCS